MKTWSSIDFMIWLCSKHETNADIKIIKETYNSFKTTLYDDFNRRLPMFGIPSPFDGKKEVSSFYIFNNKVSLLGADSDSVLHGVGSDYLYFNELLDIPESVYNQLVMRCRKFYWCDYNPKVSMHWVYNKVAASKRIGFLKTTYKDNIFISSNEKNKIESYQPLSACEIVKFLAGYSDNENKIRQAVEQAKGYDIAGNKLNFHPNYIQELQRCIDNENFSSADDYLWNVYGLGNRDAPEGLVFKKVHWVDDIPNNIEKFYYGSDIGQTASPSTLVRIGVDKVATVDRPGNMYIEPLGYEPTASTNDYVRFISDRLSKRENIFADCAEPGFINAARVAGYKVLAVNKFPGSIRYGIGLLKNYKLHIVKNNYYHDMYREQCNYKYKCVNGIALDEPIDDFNHFWDAIRYAVMSNLRLAV